MTPNILPSQPLASDQDSALAVVRVTFESLEELQTRLVLLPRVEEEGTGAVVLSLADSVDNVDRTAEGSSLLALVPSASLEDVPLEETGAPQTIVSESDGPNELLEGYELVGLDNDRDVRQEPSTTWRDAPFEDILAALRRAQVPLTLCFVPPPKLDDDGNNPPPQNDGVSSTPECEEKKEDDPVGSSSAELNATAPLASGPVGDVSSPISDGHSNGGNLGGASSGGLLGDWSGWTNRVRATSSAQLAAATTTGAALLAQAKERAAVARLATSVGATATHLAPTSGAAPPPTSTTPATPTTGATAAVPAIPSPVVLSRETSLIDQHADDEEEENDGDSDNDEEGEWHGDNDNYEEGEGHQPPGKIVCHTEDDIGHIPIPSVGLYVHNSSGAWTPLNPSSPTSPTPKPRSPGSGLFSATLSPTASAAPPDQSLLTNASLLAVRVSATQGCCTNDTADGTSTTFQWYRSTESSSHPKTSGDDDDKGDGWTLLYGATHAAFQPTAMEAGHRLRCVVTVRSTQPPSRDGGAAAEEVSGADSAEAAALPSPPQQHLRPQVQRVVALVTDGTIHASRQLFDGARQALGRTAQFAGLKGRGKLEGRSFLLQVGIGRSSGAGTKGAAVTIYQVSGQTAEPMHDEGSPLCGVSARLPDYGNAKALDLVFVSGIPDAAPMVQALATDDKRFELEAPHRISRESLLLAIGVANFAGTPGELDSSTALFVNPTPQERLNEYPVLSRVTSDGSVSTVGVIGQTEVLSPSKSPGSSPSIPGSATCDLDASPTITASIPNQNPPHSKPPLPKATIPTPVHKRSVSLGGDTEGRGDVVVAANQSSSSAALVLKLQEELRVAQTKLDGKNKVLAELQRHAARTEASLAEAHRAAAETESFLRRHDAELQRLQQAVRLAEKKAAASDELLRRTRQSHESEVAAITAEVAARDERIAELEKTVRTLQNDKAVLSGAVEAREGKLAHMASLQQSLEDLSDKVATNASLEQRIAELQQQNQQICEELGKSVERNGMVQSELDDARRQLTVALEQLSKEKSRVASHQSERDQHQIRIQKLLAERNSYKHKSDSLGREMARVCQHGRSLRDVERILAEEAGRTQEIEVLRDQKKKATEELQRYQILYEQARRVQLLAGLDCDVTKVLERNEELERLLSELTEYVSAKEMQLQTLKDVNDALQGELRELAKAHMNKNDI